MKHAMRNNGIGRLLLYQRNKGVPAHHYRGAVSANRPEMTAINIVIAEVVIDYSKNVVGLRYGLQRGAEKKLLLHGESVHIPHEYEQLATVCLIGRSVELQTKGVQRIFRSLLPPALPHLSTYQRFFARWFCRRGRCCRFLLELPPRSFASPSVWGLFIRARTNVTRNDARTVDLVNAPPRKVTDRIKRPIESLIKHKPYKP